MNGNEWHNAVVTLVSAYGAELEAVNRRAAHAEHLLAELSQAVEVQIAERVEKLKREVVGTRQDPVTSAQLELCAAATSLRLNENGLKVGAGDGPAWKRMCSAIDKLLEAQPPLPRDRQ